MKRKTALLLSLALLLSFAAGCSGKKEENISFIARVNSIYEKTILVDVMTEGLGFTSADVDLSGVEVPFEIEEEQILYITISPNIREVVPVLVTAVDIELAKDYEEISGSPIPENNSSEIPGVSMRIQYGTVTSGGLTLVISDTNDPPHTFGEWYKLDRLLSDTWVDVPVAIEGDYGFNDEGLVTDEYGQLTLTVDWRWLYGELAPGTYRIVKELTEAGTSKYLYAEFEIGE